MAQGILMSGQVRRRTWSDAQRRAILEDAFGDGCIGKQDSADRVGARGPEGDLYAAGGGLRDRPGPSMGPEP